MIRSNLRLLGLFLALALVAAGCGETDSSDVALAGSPPTTAATDTTETESSTTTTAPPATTAAPDAALPDGPSPAEPGEFAVGRRTITLIDPDRDDRTFSVDVWYPADGEAAEAAPKAVYSFIPGVEFTSEVAAADVPVTEGGPFPFVIYSHGSGGQRFQASTNAELLALCGPRNPYTEGPLGVIEEGAYADLILVDGNPLEDLDLVADAEMNFSVIMKDGKIYKNTLE